MFVSFRSCINSISLCLRTVPTYCLRVLGFCLKGLRLKSTCMEQLMMPVYGQAHGLTLIWSTSCHNKWVWPEDGSEIFILVYIVWLTNTIVSIVFYTQGCNIKWWNPLPRTFCTKTFLFQQTWKCFASGKISVQVKYFSQGQRWNIAQLAFSVLADILSVVLHDLKNFP